MNKINITINSRVYTVVADEDEKYLRNLCDYVNEKVNTVLSEGNHVTGEKPVVLAALNICDEYFKLLEKNEPDGKTAELLAEKTRLENELREIKKADKENNVKMTDIEDELDITKKVLEETEEKVTELKEQIKEKETQIKKQRSEFALREKELLDMLESK